MAQATESATHAEALNVRDYTPIAAAKGGEVIQFNDGEVGIVVQQLLAGQKGAARTRGIDTLKKTAAVVLIAGQRVYWDRATNLATFYGDFLLGSCVEDAAAGDATVKVQLNRVHAAHSELGADPWDENVVDGLGVVFKRGIHTLEMDAIAELSKADVMSVRSVAIADLPVFECRFRMTDEGDDVALNVALGLADVTHATDVDAIVNHIFATIDGNSLDIDLQSKTPDDTQATEDSTANASNTLWTTLVIDCRVPALCKVIIDGVDRTVSPLIMTGATVALKALIIIEKASNNTTAKLEIDYAILRRTAA